MPKSCPGFFLWIILSVYANSIFPVSAGSVINVLAEWGITPDDTLHVRISPKVFPESYEDLIPTGPLLYTPSNIKNFVLYDQKSGTYLLYSMLGETLLTTPLKMSPVEYYEYRERESQRQYFRKKQLIDTPVDSLRLFNLRPNKRNIGLGEQLFGSGGVKLKVSGKVALSTGFKRTNHQNPAISQSARIHTSLNIDPEMKLNLEATVGSKVNFGMNYNTETTFDYDSRKMKLTYTGDEDEIIRSIEAGNVKMYTPNSLINSGESLFGIKADLQFGRLDIKTIVSQQQSDSRRIQSRGGSQTRKFEIRADQYDENRHFFLGYYFRNTFDEAMKNTPFISSAVRINRLEVWVTNKVADYSQSRNLVAFSNLGESDGLPHNNANSLYQTILTGYPDVRNINTVNQALNTFLENGKDFEKLESARLLDRSQYVVNEKLGYITLKSKLHPDEILGVAYEYTYMGNVYQVGEFSTDATENTSDCLYIKLLKGVLQSPGQPYWHLMMKNVYSLNTFSLEKDQFNLDILYHSDMTGVFLNYLPDVDHDKSSLLSVMGLDRINQYGNTRPDGLFDFIEGYTVLPETGSVILPKTEPFGSYLHHIITDPDLVEKYSYNQLYDSTLTVARRYSEKNKFILRGQYKAASKAEIQLGAIYVNPGSVNVTAGGVRLKEHIDYVVDYSSGVVTLTNENIINSGQPVNVDLEDQSIFSKKKKTILGIDLQYNLSRKVTLGGTVLHLSEASQMDKPLIGDETIKNTLWGMNLSFRDEYTGLQKLLNKIPGQTIKQPVKFRLNTEFANLIAHRKETGKMNRLSYIDDFESSQSSFDLSNPYDWYLASVPFQDHNPLFPEASRINDISYGMNRALFAWYRIDAIFTQPDSRSMPAHIKKDKEQLSNHYVRAVNYQELYPEREKAYNENSYIPVLNLAFYPSERGPYNLDVNVLPDGSLVAPEKRWGGCMRKVEWSDFESANIEYIQFWLLDPFIYDDAIASGGELYLNLGEISEDILKDGKKFFENGLPPDGDPELTETTVWGKVPVNQQVSYAFENSSLARRSQDVGLNGLFSEEEKTFPAYRDYLEQVSRAVSSGTLLSWQDDVFSPLNDPAGDNFHHFRGSDYDRKEIDILTRYKRYNGTEGNSVLLEDSPEKYDVAARTFPDMEDLNQDNTMNEAENYYEYKISLHPNSLEVGQNFITDCRESTVKLANGNSETVKWFQFKIPVKKYTGKTGNISGFKSIRFMRMYMTGFKDVTFLRLASFQLKRNEWRVYESDRSGTESDIGNSTDIEVSNISLEENSGRRPVNYVLPPDINRVSDKSQPQLKYENEQALSLRIPELEDGYACAVYKNVLYDLRPYRFLQLFSHAEALPNDLTALRDGDLSLFIRLGSDAAQNYYQYEIPLKLTPHGTYSSDNLNDRECVWPAENMCHIRLSDWTDLKLERNRLLDQIQKTTISQSFYSIPDPEYPDRTLGICGNPNLGDVTILLIGVRNNTGDRKSVEIWVNELRMSEINERGGWAMKNEVELLLSDLGTLYASGRYESTGFGRLDQSYAERRLEDYLNYNIVTSLELGKLFPEKVRLQIPFYYAYYKETSTPYFNPFDPDIHLKTSITGLSDHVRKDSLLKIAKDKKATKSIAFNNVKIGVKSKSPMPYDPANFSFSYLYNETSSHDPETEYETTKHYKGSLQYLYAPPVRKISPFGKLKTKSYKRYLQQLSFYYLPSNVSFQTVIERNYYEKQNRSATPVSFSQQFMWNRAFSLHWNLTNHLSATFRSGTNARIEEPYMQVNKKLNPDQYKVWKDSVRHSLLHLGKPLAYDQDLVVTYHLPFQYIPVFDWINSSVGYQARYNWEKINSPDRLEMGNKIQNQRTFRVQGNFNLLSFYNKNDFLRSVNKRFSTSFLTTAQRIPRREREEHEIVLNPDSLTILKHNLPVRKVEIVARDHMGRRFPVKYKTRANNEINIFNLDTTRLKLIIRPRLRNVDSWWYEPTEYVSRFLMMLRRFSVSYERVDGLLLSGYRPDVGDLFGQRKMSGRLTPGLKFAFGAVNPSFIESSYHKDHLVVRPELTDPAIIRSSEKFSYQTMLEPIPGLRIDLQADRVNSRTKEFYYMYDRMPQRPGGNFTMTIIGVKSFFKGSMSSGGTYFSDVFQTFLDNRKVISTRIDNLLELYNYPSEGFMTASGYGGKAYQKGFVRENSQEVLIPSFLAAYTTVDLLKVKLSPFPSFASLLPNWRIVFDGLGKLPFLKGYIRNITLSHQYRGSYQVGTMVAYQNWEMITGEYGVIPNASTDLTPLPAYPYQISSVLISDGFTPLIGTDITSVNFITLSSQFRMIRNIMLSLSSFQVIESLSREWVLGVGYKITDFRKGRRRGSNRKFINELIVRCDYAYRKEISLMHKIERNLSQLSSGTKTHSFHFSTEYSVSRSLSLRAYFDLQANRPILTIGAYPVSTTQAGITTIITFDK